MKQRWYLPDRSALAAIIWFVWYVFFGFVLSFVPGFTMEPLYQRLILAIGLLVPAYVALNWANEPEN